MGSWCGTCGVTQMPINEGNPVVLVPLIIDVQESYKGGGVVRESALASPLCFPIYGTYDGYGSINFKAKDPSAAMFRQSMEMLIKAGRLIRQDGVEDTAKKSKSFQPGKFFNDLERGNLLLTRKNFEREYLETLHQACDQITDKSQRESFKKLYGKRLAKPLADVPEEVTQPLGFMLVHREVYDRLVAVYAQEESVGYHTAEGDFVHDECLARERIRKLLFMTDEGRQHIEESKVKIEAVNYATQTARRLWMALLRGSTTRPAQP